MKKIIALFLFLMCSNLIYSYTPTLRETSKLAWIWAIWEENAEAPVVNSILGVPTSIDGKTYYRISSDFDKYNWLDPSSEKNLLPIGFRFGEQKMFLYDFETQTETVALDFTLQVGEKFTTPDGTEWKVKRRKNKLLQTPFFTYKESQAYMYSEYNIVLDVESLDGKLTDQWIEKIGPLRHPIIPISISETSTSHLLMMGSGDDFFYMMAFDFNKDPLYGIHVGDPQRFKTYNDWDDYLNIPLEKSTFTYSPATAQIQFEIFFNEHPTYFYHLVYRKDDTFYVTNLYEFPLIEAPICEIRSAFTISAVPRPQGGAYRAVGFDQEIVSTSILQPLAPTHESPLLYDIAGRHLNTKPTRGLYIQDGKKHLRP